MTITKVAHLRSRPGCTIRQTMTGSILCTQCVRAIGHRTGCVNPAALTGDWSMWRVDTFPA